MTLLYLEFPTAFYARNPRKCQKISENYYGKTHLLNIGVLAGGDEGHVPPENNFLGALNRESDILTYFWRCEQLLTDAPFRGVTRGTIKARLVTFVTMVAGSNREAYKLSVGGKRLF